MNKKCDFIEELYMNVFGTKDLEPTGKKYPASEIAKQPLEIVNDITRHQKSNVRLTKCVLSGESKTKQQDNSREQ